MVFREASLEEEVVVAVVALGNLLYKLNISVLQ